MSYETDTFKRTIGHMSDEELVKRLHLGMFTDEARIVAEAEAANRNLQVDAAKIEHAIAVEEGAVREHKSQKYVNALTVLAGVTGASSLGILGGLAFLVPGRWIAKQLDSRLSSFPARIFGGLAIFLVGVLIAKLIQLVLASLLGAEPT